PPLRERREDIEPLVWFFMRELGESIGRRIEQIDPRAMTVLERYPWPGNVRELRNVVERALVLGEGSLLELDDLPPELTLCEPPQPEARRGYVRTLAEVEAEAIALALDATNGNKARAAALL